jgi:hypothetical protein
VKERPSSLRLFGGERFESYRVKGSLVEERPPALTFKSGCERSELATSKVLWWKSGPLGPRKGLLKLGFSPGIISNIR